MPHTHEYDCIVCGAHFDSMQELDQHNRREHVPQPDRDVLSADQPARQAAPRPDAQQE